MEDTINIKGNIATLAAWDATFTNDLIVIKGTRKHVSTAGKQLSDKKYIKRNKKAKAQKQSRKTNRKK